MTVSQRTFSPFYDPTALAVAARHFRFLPDPAGLGIFPWVEGRRFFFRILELAGHPYADYRSVAEHVASLDTLLAIRPGGIIEFGCIGEMDPAHVSIAWWANRHHLLLVPVTLARAPYLDIAGSWEEYRAAKRAKSWKNISRAQKLLEEKAGPLSFRILEAPEAIAGVFDSCMSLYTANWSRMNSSSIFLSETGRRFLKDLLVTLSQEGKAEISLLEQGTVLLAFSMSLKRDGGYYFYVFATNKVAEFETYSVGKILIRDLLESVFARRFTRFDFMAGEEPYKYEWTKCSQGRTSYYAVRDTFKGRAILSSFLALSRCVALLKRQRWLRRLLSCLPAVKVGGMGRKR